ncbi:hypothetical protein [Azospirillum sp. TSO22-1]|uniref:hypothetical protein n=1 Tax=Azospirillum sp. TSO22-1 TaxID=716789 RepID=UPI0011B617FD|nr:hypothetical protein [Azospirillum sp. TSO22-1]
MSEEPTLEDRLATVSNLMTLQMAPFVTPISGILDENSGQHVGSDGYVHWRGKQLLLTNDHVAATVAQHSLARKCFDSEDYIRITAPFAAKAAPYDLAVSPVDDHWNSVCHSAMSFPDHRFEAGHAPLQAEYLFVLGFTGEKSYFSAMVKMLFTPGTPYLTQEYDETLEPEETRRSLSHSAFDPDYHFALQWHPEATTATDGRKSSIPLDPHGMSGSFVWNTRLVEFTQRGEAWMPGVARLTGIV